MNRRVQLFCDWVERIPCEERFFDRPEFGFFSDLSEDELLAAEQELIRRLAVVGTEQDVRCAFLISPPVILHPAQNDS